MYSDNEYFFSPAESDHLSARGAAGECIVDIKGKRIRANGDAG